MPDSFTTFDGIQPQHTEHVRRRVLVTGARGRIGSCFAEHCHDRYDLRLMVYEQDRVAREIEAYGQVVPGDITDLDSMHRACEGIDTVIHLAGNPSPRATWASLLKGNIGGTYNTMVAAKAAGCRRVVFASSIHAVSGYPPDRQVMAEDPVNPGDLYGVSKCFGEALGRYMAQQQGLSVIACRICWFQPTREAIAKHGVAMLDAYISPRDMNQLLCKCIDDTKLRFAIVHGLSDNQFKRLDLAETRELLGYKPADDLTDLNPALAGLDLGNVVRQHDETGDGFEPGIRDELARLKGRAD